MTKLIIPNAIELYSDDARPLKQEEAIQRLFYNLRFLWLLEPGDIILLPEKPAENYLAYIADIKNCDVNAFHVIDYGLDSTLASALANDSLRQRLQTLISQPCGWVIQACYMSPSLLELAETLGIPVTRQRKEWVAKNYYRRMNSKYEFRSLATLNHIPIPEGEICSTPVNLAIAIKRLIQVTGQVIIKEEFHAGGRGNTGIALHAHNVFHGVSNRVVLNENQSVYSVSEQLWKHKKNVSQHFIVEVYYANTGSFTTQLYIPEQGKQPCLLYDAEIRMELTWAGVEIPAHRLSPVEAHQLHVHSMTIAGILQKQGYQGYVCCDAIRLHDGSIVFTEINVRPGAETNAYFLAQTVFAQNPEHEILFVTRKGITISSFEHAYQQLQNHDLLLRPGLQSGVAISCIEDAYGKQMECLFAGPDPATVYEIEQRVLEMFKNKFSDHASCLASHDTSES